MGARLSDAMIARAEALWGEGRSADEIGTALGVSRHTIASLAKRLRDRFPARRSSPWSEAMLARAAKLHRAGATFSEIAAAIGVTRVAVAGIALRRRDLFAARPAAERGKPQAKRAADIRGKAKARAKAAVMPLPMKARPVGMIVKVPIRRREADIVVVGKPLERLRPHTCRYAVGVDGAPQIFCDMPAENEISSWCPHHAALVFGRAEVCLPAWPSPVAKARAA